MTVEGVRIFGCPTCGFRVSEGDNACPRCGHEFSVSTKFECPFCGDLVDQGSKECPSCRVNYDEFRQRSEERGGDDAIDSLLIEIIELEAQSARTETKKFSCPGCSWMIDRGTERCPRCGRDFASEEEAFQCPICGSPVSAEAISCPECGSSFDLAEEVAGKEREPEQRGVSGAMAAADALERLAFRSAGEPVLESREKDEVDRAPLVRTPVDAPTPEKVEPARGRAEDQPKPEEAEPTLPEEPPPTVVTLKTPPKPETALKPEPVKVEETEEPPPEPEEATEQAKTAPAGGPKRTKQRKLKSKTPKGN